MYSNGTSLTQQAQDVVRTLNWRRCDVITSNRRQFNVMTTSCAYRINRALFILMTNHFGQSPKNKTHGLEPLYCKCYDFYFRFNTMKTLIMSLLLVIFAQCDTKFVFFANIVPYLFTKLRRLYIRTVLKQITSSVNVNLHISDLNFRWSF